MIFLKRCGNFVLDHFKFSPAHHGARVLISVLAMVAIFSLLGILSDKFAYQTQKTNIEIKFQTKDEKTMLSVLENCSGDLTNPDVIQNCMKDEYSKQVKGPAKNYKMANIKLFSWVLVWLAVIGIYISLLVIQSKHFKLKTNNI